MNNLMLWNLFSFFRQVALCCGELAIRVHMDELYVSWENRRRTETNFIS